METEELKQQRGLCAASVQGHRWDAHSVVAEPGDVALVASVEQNGSPGLLPVFVGHKVPLFEGAILEETEMINL